MTGVDPDADPVVLLTEIAQMAMDRMNTGVDVSPWEAVTLGGITALAVRCPGVVEGLKDSLT